MTVGHACRANCHQLARGNEWGLRRPGHSSQDHSHPHPWTKPCLIQSHSQGLPCSGCCCSGSECWILFAAMRDKILKFHRRCIRFMCGVTLDSMQSKNIHHSDLEKRLRISDVLSILESRRLQWLGHVYRMPADSLGAFSLRGSPTRDPKDVHTLHMGMD